MLNLIIGAVLIGALAYVVYRVVAYYRSTQGTVWEKLLGTAKNSATVFMGMVATVGANVLAWAGNVGDLVGQPEVKDWIQGNIKDPRIVGGLLLVVVVLMLLGRFRTLWQKA